MADYRLHAQIISRSEGKSAVAAAAYRASERILDERTGDIKDFTRKSGVLYTEILTPGNAPEWMRNRASLWNAVEHREDKSTRRSTAQLARELQLSLPHELTHEQRIELARDFIKKEFVEHGIVADIAFHAPSRNGDARNYHAHVLLTLREIRPDGFGKKARLWERQELTSKRKSWNQFEAERLVEWRRLWAVYENRALARYGHKQRVDHRRLEDQGIDREPTTHIGPDANEMERRGIDSDRGNQNRRIKAANDDLALLKKELTESEKRLAELRRQLAAERMEQIQNTVRTADTVWEKVEQRQAQAGRLQPQGSKPPSHPEDSTRPVSAGGKAPSMPDNLSQKQKAATPESIQQTLDAEQKRQDDAIAAELKRQEDARREQDQLRDALIAADEKLKELGRIYREAQEFRERLIQQSRELDAAHLAHELQMEKQIHLEKPILENPVETYLKERSTAIEDRRQELLDKRDRGYLEGDIRDAGTRYAQALHHNYDFGDPFQSLAKCAIAEHAAFRNDQDLLSAEIAKTADPKAREALEIRRKIEGYEYLMITGDRIAAQSEIITGRLSSDEAKRMRGLVHGKDILDENGKKVGFEDGYKQKAHQLRQQYRDLQAERTAPKKEQTLDQLIKEQDEKQKAKEQQQKNKAPERQTKQEKESAAPEKRQTLDDIIKKQDDQRKEKERQEREKDSERQKQQERERELQRERDRER
jgi:hypothetical protein